MALVKTTESVRISLDVELSTPHDAKALYRLREEVVRAVNALVPNVDDCQGTQIIPAETNFDWQGL